MRREQLRILLTLHVLALSACSVHPIHGQLETSNRQPLPFRAEDKSLLLNPGPLTADIGNAPASSGFLRLKNSQGEIELKTRPEHFKLNFFALDHAKDNLSADLKGVWRENTERVITVRELEACTAPGYCLRTDPVLICPGKEAAKSGDGCKKIYETRMRYAYDCPGSVPVEKNLQTYVLSLELDFYNPAEPKERLAHYQGQSPLRQRVLTRQEIGPCIVR